MDFKTEDLHKIIDDAVEKKDREVTIFISKDHAYVTVTPFTDSKPRWIECESILGRIHRRYQCSECGAYQDFPAPFCPMCGEKLATARVEKEDTDDESQN